MSMIGNARVVKYLKKAEPELRQHNRDLVERVPCFGCSISHSSVQN